MRLVADYNQMMAIRGAVVAWEPVRGSEPHVEAYRLILKVRTIIGPGPDYADEVRATLELGAKYPFSEAPRTVAEPPVPYHPNWYASGLWDRGMWSPLEGLGAHVIRLVRTAQFAPELVNLTSPSNAEATRWWRSVANRGWFPSDRQAVPELDSASAARKAANANSPIEAAGKGNNR
jgi:hypothetical protein